MSEGSNRRRPFLRGASGLTYAVIVGLISVVAIASIQRIGSSANTLMGTVATRIAGTRPATIATAPAATPDQNVFYQCGGFSSYVVFARNTENRSLSSFQAVRDACVAYGFRGLASDKSQMDRGWGLGNSSDQQIAISCHNCHWADGGNAWYFNYPGGNQQNCTHVRGTMASGSTIGGAVLNGNPASLNCATTRLAAGPGAVFGRNDTNPSTFPDSLFVQSDPNCSGRTNTSNSSVSTNTPNYVLCATATLPP